ncbi:MAG: carboxypeptidase regulatory-like domain-containing protein [Candidatus Eremiobacteraeota bacterium]|nr:carboxypeptidase regulatory-like domain-containing protein [Candidatus Eremiobacteraeota bacterium]
MKNQKELIRLLALSVIMFAFLLLYFPFLSGCSGGEEKKEDGNSTQTGSVSGVVCDKEGASVSEATVNFEYTDDTPASPSPEPTSTSTKKPGDSASMKADATTTTGSNGSFTFSSLQVSREGTIIAFKDDVVIGSKNVIVQEITEANINSSGTVNGVITSDGKTPESDVSVSIGLEKTATNSNGNYTLGGAPLGQQTLRATKSGFQVWSDEITVLEGELTYQDITLEPDVSPTSTPSPTTSPTASPTSSPSASPTSSPTSSPSPSPSATGSPMPAQTYTYVEKWSDGISSPGNLCQGSVFGSSFAGTTLFRYSEAGVNGGAITVPQICNGVTMKAGNLYASSNQSAKFYKLSGVDFATVDTYTLGGTSSGLPRDIAAENLLDQVFVLTGSTTKFNVEIYTTGGDFVSEWGDSQSYKNPQSIAISPTGTVYISFLGNDKVAYFNQQGSFQGYVSVNMPYGIFIDSNSQLYVNYTVSSATNARGIAVYDINHILVGQHISEYGSGEDQMKNPFGIVVDGDGNIYVSDIGDSKVVKFTKD